MFQRLWGYRIVRRCIIELFTINFDSVIIIIIIIIKTIIIIILTTTTTIIIIIIIIIVIIAIIIIKIIQLFCDVVFSTRVLHSATS